MKINEKNPIDKLISIVICFSIICMVFVSVIPINIQTFATSSNVDYPVQMLNISNGSGNVCITNTTDISSLTLKDITTNVANWSIRYVGKDSKGSYYKIVNMESGRLLTPMNYDVSKDSECVIYGDESDKSQHWYITAVSQDNHQNDLYYKITNYVDNNLALTYDGSKFYLSDYDGKNQNWLLNTAGVQGFAGSCIDFDSNLKSSVHGGVFGDTVYVSTFDELKKACNSTEPLNIIITKDISCTASYTTDNNGRKCIDSNARIYIYPNKTIIGSYSGTKLYNVYFRTYEHANYGLGKDIIIRNIEISHDVELNNDNIWEFSYGENIWIDHCTFVGHDKVNSASTGTDDWDKFLNFKGTTDYCTISDCYFGLHEYGVLMGYPTDTDEIMAQYNGMPCITIANNYYKDCLTRAPGLMRYGYFHSLNNYVLNFDLSYTIHTASTLYAESCYYDGGTGKGSVVNDNATQITQISESKKDEATPYYIDVNSIAINCYNDNNLNNIYSKVCTWKPSSNYDYQSMGAESVPTYCTTNAGAKTSRSSYSYYTFGTTGIASANYSVSPTTKWEDNIPVSTIKESSVIEEGKTFTLKNVNSNLYMEVADAKSENGANVQQWGMLEPSKHNTWTVKSANDGYYYIYSSLGDGKTYLLDLDRGLVDNGTNIGIYEDTNSDAQLFKFVKNDDGSYKIVTKITEDASCIEIKDGSTSSGANVQQWIINGFNCQDWILEYCNLSETTTISEIETTAITTTTDITSSFEDTSNETSNIITTITDENTEVTTITDTIPTDTNIIGDLDNNQTINYLDLLILKKCVLNIDSNSKADVNGDTLINILDVIALKSIIINS